MIQQLRACSALLMAAALAAPCAVAAQTRSEEHTSELQSQSNLVCRLLLEGYDDHRDLHSFPTRRSSDLKIASIILKNRYLGLYACDCRGVKNLLDSGVSGGSDDPAITCLFRTADGGRSRRSVCRRRTD